MASDITVWLSNLTYARLIGGVLPRRWFGPEPPPRASLTAVDGRPTLEIVAHCWNYAHMLRFQLSSLVMHPPTAADVRYTLYHSAEDSDTLALIERYAHRRVPNVTWQWRAVPTERLLRRAIGRNEAALTSTADRLWFTDCDVIFHAGALDAWAAVAQRDNAPLLHPEREFVTALLPAEHPLLAGGRDWRDAGDGAELVDIDTALFEPRPLTRATGPHQIVHADVARTIGYCRDLSLYQRPTDRWRKTYEDSAFRRLLGSEGEPAPIGPVYRIRHVEKGRYGDDGVGSRVRARVRAAEDARA